MMATAHGGSWVYKAIVLCVGNRYVHPDGAACWLYDQAQTMTWPDGLQWVDGGLGGLSLLPWFEKGLPVLLLDYMPDFENGARISPEALTLPEVYDHAHALSYLLQQLPNLVAQMPALHLLACRPETAGWEQTVLQQVDAWYSTLN